MKDNKEKNYPSEYWLGKRNWKKFLLSLPIYEGGELKKYYIENPLDLISLRVRASQIGKSYGLSFSIKAEYADNLFTIKAERV